jgi:hypothetical protein
LGGSRHHHKRSKGSHKIVNTGNALVPVPGFERRKGRCRTQGVTMKIPAFQAEMAGVPPAGRCYRVYIALSGKNNL